MTVDEAKRRIAEIVTVGEALHLGGGKGHWMDDESAHILEDALHRDILKAVASGHPDSKALAAAGLETLKLKFARWCA